MTHKDPEEYCIKCGHRYDISDEVCDSCGFEPIGSGRAEQAKAESDFSAWANSGRDGE